jgi:hypothetical protein
VTWGECGHAFHLHCLNAWLTDKKDHEQTCPICRRKWEFKNIESATANDDSNSSAERNADPIVGTRSDGDDPMFDEQDHTMGPEL